jgi:hypothetical protein
MRKRPRALINVVGRSFGLAQRLLTARSRALLQAARQSRNASNFPGSNHRTAVLRAAIDNLAGVSPHREPAGSPMSLLGAIGLSAALGVAVYLLVALLLPEKFQ